MSEFGHGINYMVDIKHRQPSLFCPMERERANKFIMIIIIGIRSYDLTSLHPIDGMALHSRCREIRRVQPLGHFVRGLAHNWDGVAVGHC